MTKRKKFSVEYKMEIIKSVTEQGKIRGNNLIQSMSAKGSCYDNACAESLFSSLKKDIIYGRKFKTRTEAR